MVTGFRAHSNLPVECISINGVSVATGAHSEVSLWHHGKGSAKIGHSKRLFWYITRRVDKAGRNWSATINFYKSWFGYYRNIPMLGTNEVFGQDSADCIPAPWHCACMYMCPHPTHSMADDCVITCKFLGCFKVKGGPFFLCQNFSVSFYFQFMYLANYSVLQRVNGHISRWEGVGHIKSPYRFWLLLSGQQPARRLSLSPMFWTTSACEVHPLWRCCTWREYHRWTPYLGLCDKDMTSSTGSCW